MSVEYKIYLEKWLTGIQDELNFWNDYMDTQGDIYKDDYEDTICNNKKFVLDDDIDEKYLGKDFKFIDVGSGPFSRCGKITEKVDMNFTAADPLAEAYNDMKKIKQIDNGIVIDTAFVELLDKKYGKNVFDMVHMSNSLDHCFDALCGIYQLIYICKIGGKIILRHAENEAERSEYEGFHQWNLSVHNEEKSFIIWRGKRRINISEELGEYVDIYIYPDQKEGGWQYNKVVMIKKKDIEVPQNGYYEEMLYSIYSFLLKFLMEYSMKSQKDLIVANRNAIEKIKNGDFIEGFPSQGSIDVYGLGVVGRELIDKFQNLGYHVEKVYDRQKRKYKNIESEDLVYKDRNRSNIIVNSVMRDNDEIIQNLISCGYSKNNIFLLQDLFKKGE